MLGDVSVLLLDFASDLGMHGVFLVKRRVSQVLGQFLKLIGPHGILEFNLGLVLVGAVVMVRVFEIYYGPLIIERPSSC